MRISKLAGLALLAFALGRPEPARAQGFGLDLSPGGSNAPQAVGKDQGAKKKEAKKPAPPTLDFGGLDLTSDGARAKKPAPAADAKVAPPLPPPPAESKDPLPAPPALPAVEAAPDPAPPALEPAPTAPVPESVDESFAPDPTTRRVQPVAYAVVGPGAVFRSLNAGSGAGLVPRAGGAMTGLGVDASFFPARLDPNGERGPLSNLSLEAHYRRTFASAQLQTDAGEASCSVDDDEVLVRAAYRYPLPGEHLPRVGVSAGWGSERVLLRCSAPALSTRVRGVELQLTALEPVLGERLQIVASGGPRFVISAHSAQAPARSYSLELWLASHPATWFFARGGVRFTATREQTEGGVGVAERRAFTGVELGAAY